MNMFMVQTVVIVSQTYTYLQTHQFVYNNYAQVSECQSYLNKVLKNIFKTIRDQENGIKTQLNSHFTHAKIAKIKIAGKDMKQFSPSCIADQSVNMVQLL